MSESPITVRELKDYTDRLARETREIAADLAKDTEIWRITVETRLSKLEVKMNLIAFLAGSTLVLAVGEFVRLMIH